MILCFAFWLCETYHEGKYGKQSYRFRKIFDLYHIYMENRIFARRSKKTRKREKKNIHIIHKIHIIYENLENYQKIIIILIINNNNPLRKFIIISIPMK